MRTSQRDNILADLLAGMRLTTITAKARHGTTELRSRIAELKARGHIIHSEYVKLQHPGGGTTRFKEYWMDAGEQGELF